MSWLGGLGHEADDMGGEVGVVFAVVFGAAAVRVGAVGRHDGCGMWVRVAFVGLRRVYGGDP